jgi:hypothetical protein
VTDHVTWAKILVVSAVMTAAAVHVGKLLKNASPKFEIQFLIPPRCRARRHPPATVPCIPSTGTTAQPQQSPNDSRSAGDPPLDHPPRARAHDAQSIMRPRSLDAAQCAGAQRCVRPGARRHLGLSLSVCNFP